MNIFLSYASEDRELADEIQLALAGGGYEVFFDREDLPPGGDYHARIKAAVESSDIFVFLISHDSLSQGSYTLTELKYARAKWPHPKGRVLPILVRRLDWESIPGYLKAVTVLEPEGNIPAEALLAISGLAEEIKVSSAKSTAPSNDDVHRTPQAKGGTSKALVAVLVTILGMGGILGATLVGNREKISTLSSLYLAIQEPESDFEESPSSLAAQVEQARVELANKLDAGNADLAGAITRLEQLLEQAKSLNASGTPLDPISSQLAKDTLQKAYINATKLAKMRDVQKKGDLTAITKTTNTLHWDGEPGKSRILVVTWTRSRYHSHAVGGDTTFPFDLWVTVVPELRNFCMTHPMPPNEIPLRIAQLLGMPPSSLGGDLDAFVELWVQPQDLFRPALDPDITGTGIASEFPQDVDPQHIEWFNKIKKLEEGFPTTWTGLGYTYDWGNPESDVGLSEFVVREGSTVRVHSIIPVEQYCKSTNA